MTSVRKSLLYFNPINIRNLKSFYVEEGITIDYNLDEHILTVTTSNKTSNKGIFYNKDIEIPAGKHYEFTVRGAALNRTKVYLWMRNQKTKEMLTFTHSQNTVYLPNTNDLNVTSYVVGGFDKKTKVKIGLKFESPYIGDQFELESMALMESHSVNIGRFRLYDTTRSLVVEHKTSNTEKWDFIAAFNAPDNDDDDDDDDDED